ncbi:MAG: hypothetical protein HPY66_0134 [Firmicutes bacterium]|nr:hypothetical protein [Bacillota bacterium]
MNEPRNITVKDKTNENIIGFLILLRTANNNGSRSIINSGIPIS